MTEEETATLRAMVAKEFKIDEFTCDDCSDRLSCPCAFDAYNTAGDCLMEK